MNKITSILAGLALVAGVSVAPAFAQGNLFSPPGSSPSARQRRPSPRPARVELQPGQRRCRLDRRRLHSDGGTLVTGTIFRYNLTIAPPASLGLTAGIRPTGPLPFTVFACLRAAISVASVGAASARHDLQPGQPGSRGQHGRLVRRAPGPRRPGGSPAPQGRQERCLSLRASLRASSHASRSPLGERLVISRAWAAGDLARYFARRYSGDNKFLVDGPARFEALSGKIERCSLHGARRPGAAWPLVAIALSHPCGVPFAVPKEYF